MERLMGIKNYVRQVRPVQEAHINHLEKIQNLLSEGKISASDIFTKDKTRDNKNTFIKKAIAGELLDSDGNKIPKIDENSDLITHLKGATESSSETNALIKTAFGKSLSALSIDKPSNGFAKGSGTDPKGADWENIITKQFNNLVKQPDFDKAANEAADKFPDYADMGLTLAKNIKSKVGDSPITQFGGGKAKSNLSSFWTTWGAGDGTPKTDMYNKEYNISLKKKGGSQLASGSKGETLATFYAALEYLGTDRGANPEIDKIMKAIEDNFVKLSTKYTKSQLVKISKDKDMQKKLPPKDKKALAEFITTEAFHKELNKELEKHLSFEKQPEFLKWYTFEAMSGYKKFSIPKGKASVCLEFDADNGTVSKFIEVTKKGKSSGLLDDPSVSADVISISKKVKVFSAWKSGKGNPYSSFRLGLSNDFTTEDTTDTLREIIRKEVMNDNIANAVLVEEITQLDEFAIIGKTFAKLKSIGKNAFNWLKNLINKIMKKVKQTLDKIKEMGAKLFETLFKFLGIELKSVTESLPSDINGFVYGMAE
jgi:hypothetical protein